MKKKVYSEKIVKQVINLYLKEGKTKREIAKMLDIKSGKDVAGILKNNNISNRPSQSEIFLSELGSEKIKDLYIRQNLSLTEIGEIYNFTWQTVGYAIKKLGIKKDKELIKQSCIRNSIRSFRALYGTDYPFQNKENLSRINKIAKEKYNVESNIFQSQEIKQKIKDSNKKKV